MPKVTPGAGQAVEETTVTRIIPAMDPPADKISSDALEYMELCPPDKWAEGNHIAYIYRVDPPVIRNAAGPTYVTKYATPISLEQIQQEWGGGLWRILVKRGSERMADRNYPIAGTARDLSRTTHGSESGGQNGNSQQQDTGAITPNSVGGEALRLITNPANAQVQVQMAFDTLRASLDVMRAQMPHTPSLTETIQMLNSVKQPSDINAFFSGPLGQIAMTVISALVQKIITPVDPLDQIQKMAAVMQAISGGNNGGNPAADWKAALVNALPQVMNAARDTVQTMADAQMRAAPPRILPAAPMVPQTPAVPLAQNPATQNVLKMPAPPPAAPVTPEMIDQKLIDLLNDPAVTGEQAGEIMDQFSPQFVDEVSKLTVEQFMAAFRVRPLLQPHASNPRLPQFLSEFLEWAKESDTPSAGPYPVAPQPVA